MRAYLEINTKILEENYQKIRKATGKEIIPVIKSNAYGHGLIECARTFFRQKAPMLAVATLEEAIAVRKSLIFTPILLLGESFDFKTLSSYHITAVILGLNHLTKLASSPYPIAVHLMIDTGMNREGISEDQLKDAKDILRSSKLVVKGLCTHYSSSAAYPNERAIFERVIASFPHKDKWMIHASCSSTYQENHDDPYLRIGLLLYGEGKNYPSALSLWAPIIRKKPIKKGETVGYNESESAPEDGYLYTVGLGYADGWPRGYQAKAYYGDHKLVQIGATCMDYMMFFAPDSYDENGVLEMIGPHQSAAMIAQEQGTIIYEVYARLSSRLKRQLIPDPSKGRNH